MTKKANEKEAAKGTEAISAVTIIPEPIDELLNGKQNAQELPFFEQKLNIPSWDTDLIGLDTGYIPISKGSEDAIKKTDVPALFISAEVLQEIYYIARRMGPKTGEVGGYLLTQKISDQFPIWLAHSHFLVAQRASGGEASFDGLDADRHFKWLRTKYPDGHFKMENVGHYHSHNNMDTFWSSTDKRLQESRSVFGFNGNYRWYVVINVKGEIRLAFVQYYPVFHRWDEPNYGIFARGCSELSTARKKELDSIMDALVKRPVPPVVEKKTEMTIVEDYRTMKKKFSDTAMFRGWDEVDAHSMTFGEACAKTTAEDKNSEKSKSPASPADETIDMDELFMRIEELEIRVEDLEGNNEMNEEYGDPALRSYRRAFPDRANTINSRTNK